MDNTHIKLYVLYLNFSIALASKHMPAILDGVLNQFSS